MSLIPSGYGLAGITRAQHFRGHSHKLNEYLGEALSYRVLEEWASSGQGAAILAKSKPRSFDRKAYVLIDKQSGENHAGF